MAWVFAGVIVAVVTVTLMVAAGRFGSQAPQVPDLPVVVIPKSSLSGNDIRKVRFAVVTRGYKMSQVDELLSRLADQIDKESSQKISSDSTGLAKTGDQLTHADYNGLDNI